MRFTCRPHRPRRKLNVLARGVSTRSALPVLSGVLLQAREGRLDLFSTDMELSIKASLDDRLSRAKARSSCPARLFTDVVKNMPSGTGPIEAGEGSVKITAGKAVFTLNAWVASDFPQTSTFDMEGGLHHRPRSRLSRRSRRSAGRLRGTRRGRSSPGCSSTWAARPQDGRHRQLPAELSKRRRSRADRRSEVAGDRPGQGAQRGGTSGRGPRRRHDRGRDHREPGPVRLATRSATCGSPRGSSTASSRTTGSSSRRASTTGASLARTSSPRRPGAPACWRRRTRPCGSILSGQADDPRRHSGRRPSRRVTRHPVHGDEFEIGFNPQFLIEGIEAVDESDVNLQLHEPAAPGPRVRARTDPSSISSCRSASAAEPGAAGPNEERPAPRRCPRMT